MQIAVACDGLSIAPTLAQCSSYMCYTISDGIPVNCRNMLAMDQPVSNLPSFFEALGTDVLITNLLDEGIAAVLDAAGLTVVTGKSGDPLTAVREYLQQ